MDITSKCGKYIAKLTDDLSGETYIYKYWNCAGAHEEIKPLYYIVTIYKVDDTDSAILIPIHTYKECRRGPQTYNMAKAFIRVNGVMWFIGALNYSVKYYVNCETGIGYTAPEDKYRTWHKIKACSPNGTHIIVYTYCYNSPCNSDSTEIFDISQLDTKGAVQKFLAKVPAIFNITDETCIYEFTGNSETEIKLSYYNEYNEGEAHNINYDIGVFQIS